MFLKEGYEVFVRSLEELAEGKEIEMQIRDCQTAEVKVVKAILFPPGEEVPEGETVWIRSLVGHLLDERPWRMKVTQVLKKKE